MKSRNYRCDKYEDARPTAVPAGMRGISATKPCTHHCSYSNEASQGALIAQTPGFPAWYDPSENDFHAAYSDRIQGWDAKRHSEACKIAGGGDQAWAYRLPSLSPERLREFARVALDLKEPPAHVRVVHHFNVANGFSCPTVEAIAPKAKL